VICAYGTAADAGHADRVSSVRRMCLVIRYESSAPGSAVWPGRFGGSNEKAAVAVAHTLARIASGPALAGW
jgi:hypothetical protein